MKHTNLYFSKCIAMLVLALCFCAPMYGAFSLVHKTGAYDELQENGMQKVHTDYQIMYAKPGETVNLYRPERATFVGYVRWYCYDTDRAVPSWYSAADSPTEVAIPRIQSTWAKDTLEATLKFKARNEYGWFGYVLATDGKATKSDENYVEIKYTMHNGDSIYRIACDQGVWNDYSPSTWNNNTAMTEPTLSKRTIYEIRPASWMADSLELCKDMDGTNDRYLEEHELIAPAGRQLYIGPDYMCLGNGVGANIGTKVALPQYTYYAMTNYYYINSQSNVTPADNKSNWKWYIDGVYNKSGFSAKTAQFAAFSNSSPGTVVYTLKYNSATGVYFNVARFKVTYMDVDQVGPSENVPAPTKKMEKIYEQRFNYNEPGTTDFAFWNGYFDVDESTYGYYTKNISASNRQSKSERNKITWSEYAVTNRKSVWVSSGTAPQVYQHVDGKGNEANNAKEGYMLYCDGSQNPGQVFNLKVDADLCAGSTMYFSAWLCDASSTGDANKSAPNMDFVVTGIDASGNEHALTTFTTGEFGINAVAKVGEEAKMERAKWYQIMFPVKFEAHTTYPSYRLRITNKSTSSDGNDFAIDDIRIYVQRPPVMPIQASTSDCVDEPVQDIRTYLRIDYQELEDNIDKLYYQWREGDRILKDKYYNIDSVSHTFGCVPILPDAAAIESSGLTSANLLAFDAAYRTTTEPIYRYIMEEVSPGVSRYVLYVAQPMEVQMNHNYTGFVALHPEALGTREGCGTFADLFVAGGTRIIIEDHVSLGDSVVTLCGHRTYTLNIVLTQIIQDYSDPDDPLKEETTLCSADWMLGDTAYVRQNPDKFGGYTFEQIWQALQLYRESPDVNTAAKEYIMNLVDDGLFYLNTPSITMLPSKSLSYTAFPRAGSAGSKQVCTSPRFLHIRPSTEIATMMAVGNAGEELPAKVVNLPRVVRISNAQKLRGSFRLPLYLKGEDNDDDYDIERVVLESSTNPYWSEVELNFNKVRLEKTDEIELSGPGLTSLEAGYDYTFHIVFEGEETEHVGCERGRTYFTLRIVPDVVTWLGGNWNVDFNWSPFIPLEETDVILLPQNYNVTFGDTIYDFGYQKNHCKDIYMPAGMSMAGQQNINIHGQVYIDVPLVTHKWNLTSIPLQGVVSGDIFSSQNEETNPFAVADIDQSGIFAPDRHIFEIYQSYYDVAHDKWHVPTNKLTSELHPAEPYMMGVATDPSAPDTAIVRLPKPGNLYHYYDFYTHEWLDESETIVRNPNYGKPAWNGEPNIALREVYGNVYLLGNPTFGHINIKKLVEDNPDKLTGRYTMPEPTDVEPTAAEMTVFTHDVATEEDDVLLPPLKGILLEGKGEASAELIISISAKDITEPGFAPKKANVAPRRSKKHESPFNDGGGIPTGAIKSTAEPVVVSETDIDIFDKLDLYHDGIINTLHLNRTLYRDGAFNTLCLPFSMSESKIAASPLAGMEIYEYLRAEKAESGLDIYMRKVTSITAGVPYLVKWDMDETEPIPMPLVFNDVHITALESEPIGAENEIRFVGNIAIGTLELMNTNHLFIGAANTLYWPEFDIRLKGFRAHFRVPTEGPAAAPRHTPARIVLQKETTTGIEYVQYSEASVQKIIRDGKVYILRDGKLYSILGQNIK